MVERGSAAYPSATGDCRRQRRKGCLMLFALFYVLAISILIMHFTGFLARHRLEWLVLLLAAAVFPAVIYLR
jgi:predicted permease